MLTIIPSKWTLVRTIHDKIVKYSDKFLLIQCTSSIPRQPASVISLGSSFVNLQEQGYSGYQEGIVVTDVDAVPRAAVDDIGDSSHA